MSLTSLCSQLEDWFWQHGKCRRGPYELSLSGWTHRLYAAAEVQRAVTKGKSQKKPTFAVWGPSQTGKSTLISSYIDNAADAVGSGSALHWPGGPPARFVVGSRSPRDAVILNPFNQGSDASGCVSRFRLEANVPDARFPVEVKLSDPFQVRHALTLGYLSECRRDNEPLLTPDIIASRIEALIGAASATEVSRKSFAFAHRLADLLDTLSLSGIARFKGCRGKIDDIRGQLLEHGALGIPDMADRVAADLLWDGHPVISGLYGKLVAQLARLRELWGGKPVFCSLRVASLLLDSASYQHLLSGLGDLPKVFAGLSFEATSDRVNIGNALSQNFLLNEEQFAAFQGLVFELVIPLKKDVLAASSPKFCQFLEAADLVDFPGTSQEDPQTEYAQLNLDKMSPDSQAKLYTKLIKRGKTASIVAEYARDFTIDGFVLMNRMGEKVRKPDQLIAGIFTWWQRYRPDYDPRRGEKSPLPLNFAFTFCAKAVNELSLGGIRRDLSELFSDLEKLGPLAKPEVLHRTLATNYPHLPPGYIPLDEEQRGEIIRDIGRDPHFRRHFATESCQRSFKEAVENGGTDFVFMVLLEQAKACNRESTLADRELIVSQELRTLIGEALPLPENRGDLRRVAFASWKQALKSQLDQSTDYDPAERISFTLRVLTDVEPDFLSPVPQALHALTISRVDQYVAEQFVKWIESRIGKLELTSALSNIGVDDRSHLSKMLHLWVEAVERQSIARWLKEHLGYLETSEESRHARRFLALKMSNALQEIGVSTARSALKYPDSGAIQQDVDAYFARDLRGGGGPWDSPHCQRVIVPFLETLDRIAGSTVAGERPMQPGDEELQKLTREYPQFQAR